MSNPSSPSRELASNAAGAESAPVADSLPPDLSTTGPHQSPAATAPELDTTGPHQHEE